MEIGILWGDIFCPHKAPTIVCGLLAWTEPKLKTTAHEGPELSYIPFMLPEERKRSLGEIWKTEK